MPIAGITKHEDLANLISDEGVTVIHFNVDQGPPNERVEVIGVGSFMIIENPNQDPRLVFRPEGGQNTDEQVISNLTDLREKLSQWVPK